MNKPVFIDIYRGDPVTDFAQTKASGIIGCIHKATEGGGYIDTLYAHRREMWMQGGLIPVTDFDGQALQVAPMWGAYHFLHGENPVTEARHFVDVAKPDALTCMVVDWEEPPGKSSAIAVACKQFVIEVERLIGRSVVIYSGNVAKERINIVDPWWGERRLWLAQYGSHFTTQASWHGKPWAWQNNGDNLGPGPHHIPGISGLCDNSTITEGTIREFVTTWSGAKTAPVVAITPAAPVTTIPITEGRFAMDWLTIIQLAMQWGPTVKSILDEANTNDDITTKIKAVAPDLAGILETIGAKMFPKAAPALHVAAAAIAAFDPNVTKWLQGSLNALVTPSPNLVVDGSYGPKTKAAVEQAQAKLGLKVDGIAGLLTQAAITAALGVANPVSPP